MNRIVIALALALPVTLAGAQDWNLVVVPAPDHPQILIPTSFQLFARLPDYWLGSWPQNETLPPGGRLLPEFRREGGELYVLHLSQGSQIEQLTGRVTLLFQHKHQAVIQATAEQYLALREVKAERQHITLTPKPITLPASAQPHQATDFDPIVQEMVDQVSLDSVTLDMQTLQDFGTRYTLTPDCDSAAYWLLEQFQRFGLEAYLDSFTLLVWTKYNVVGQKTGLIYPDSIVLVTGHYDSFAYQYSDTLAPGADDNASGTACVLECARILSQYNFEKTIRFVAFGGEELGLWGSADYVADLQAAGANVVGCFNYDMIAWSGNDPLPRDLWLIADYNPLSQEMANRVSDAIAEFIPDSLEPVVYFDPSAGRSDHASFWDAGWPAILGIEYEFEGPEFNPYYHSPGDLVSNCDLPYATNCVRAGLAALADYAGSLGEGTQISGSVSGTWTFAGSPYYIVDSLWIPNQGSLTIEPGVLVLFDGHYPLNVLSSATLRAIGTVDEPIKFLALNPTAGWGGIRFLNASDSCRLEFCHLRFGWANGSGQDSLGGALFCSGSSPTLEHCLLSQNQAGQGGAIACLNQSHPVLNHCTISGNIANQGGACYCQNSNPTMTNSILWGDSPPEILTEGSSSPQISYSDVQGDWSGPGNLDLDPYFIDATQGNYRLQSTVNTNFSHDSPCQDAGNPASPFDLEPEPNGNRVDQGMYGNTTWASLSPDDPLYANGDVSGLWTVATNNPMHVISDIFVPAGDTLIIEPGVQVVFEGHFQMTVDPAAILQAVGTQTDSIIFIPTDPTVGWAGLRFVQASDSCRLEYCLIRQGRATGSVEEGYGGGLYCESSHFTIQHCRIDSCWAYRGGGIYLKYAHPVIEGCEIEANSANDGGALFLDVQSFPLIQGCSIQADSAINGAALYFWFAGGTFRNNLICNNTASLNGGVVYCLLTRATFENNTIWGNTAISGNAFAFVGSDTLILVNNILWENSPNLFALFETDSLLVQYSDVQGGWPGLGNIESDPLFINPDLGDFHLQPNSACIDSGHPDPLYFDPEDPANPGLALWPAQGTLRNDMGAYGGAGAGIVVGVSPENHPIALPLEFSLQQNYPNPFNAATVISFELPVASYVRLEVFDVTGRRVGVGLAPTHWYPAGMYKIIWNASGFPSGIYFCRFQAGEFIQIRKMLLLK